MVHVYPIDEESEHELGEETTCPCGVTVEWQWPTALVIHQRFHPDREGVAEAAKGRVGEVHQRRVE
jgi:hypothetical protein